MRIEDLNRRGQVGEVMQDFDFSKAPTEQGLYRRYGKIERVDGKDDGPNAEYFVLRIDDLLDKPDSPEAVAMRAYSKAVAPKYPDLAADLQKRLPEAPTRDPSSYSWEEIERFECGRGRLVRRKMEAQERRITELEDLVYELVNATVDSITHIDPMKLIQLMDGLPKRARR